MHTSIQISFTKKLFVDNLFVAKDFLQEDDLFVQEMHEGSPVLIGSLFLKIFMTVSLLRRKSSCIYYFVQ